ncbi:MAG: hypothetical protein QGF00_31845 [Planctomycetota bacterium]|nr:hypothetical protein [Planctomycetota bacterium]MDP7254235.1 hypothetical protein [Planctomycetota bacterium]
MSLSSTTPYTDPGMLGGGVREQRAIMNHLLSEGFRSASQSANTDQAARAFSGGNVDNDQTQAEDVTQTVVTLNRQQITIQAVQATNANAANFNSNYLQRYIAGANAEDYLAKAGSQIVQDQSGAQVALAKLNDFSGTDSDAENDINQRSDTIQQFDIDLSATVSNTTIANEIGNAFNSARFREIQGSVGDLQAQAVFAHGQRQGSATNPVTQRAIADGGVADNDITQDTGITSSNNRIDLIGSFDLSKFEIGNLSPRSTNILAAMNANPNHIISAVSKSTASQDQNHLMVAGAGEDEGIVVTENNGRAKNTGNASMDNTESTTVNNSVSLLI